MPYNIKQLGEKSVGIDFFIADPRLVTKLYNQILQYFREKTYLQGVHYITCMYAC